MPSISLHNKGLTSETSVMSSLSVEKLWFHLLSIDSYKYWFCDEILFESIPNGRFCPSGSSCLENYGGRIIAVDHENHLIKFSWKLSNGENLISISLSSYKNEVENIKEGTIIRLVHKAKTNWSYDWDVYWYWKYHLTLFANIGHETDLNNNSEYSFLKNDYSIKDTELIWFGLYFKKHPKYIFNALTRDDELRKWLSPLAEFNIKENKIYFGLQDIPTLKVLSIKKNRLIIHEWNDPVYSILGKVTWSIFPEKGNTNLEFLHEGVPPKFISFYRLYWTSILTLLQHYLNTI